MENQEFIQERQANGLREFLTIVFKHKTKIVAVFTGIVVTATVVSFLMTPVYEAQSSVLVKIGREYLSRPEVGSNAPIMALDPGRGSEFRNPDSDQPEFDRESDHHSDSGKDLSGIAEKSSSEGEPAWMWQ